METNEPFLTRRRLAGIEQFEANEHGIAVLKAEFLAEADDFLYLRKGEDFGGDVIGYMSVCVNSLADISIIDALKDLLVFITASEKVRKYYPEIVQMIADLKTRFSTARWKRKPKNLMLLLWPDERNEDARPLYEKQGYAVRFYASELDKGHHRLYLNEKRYCWFLRTGKDRFVGFIGGDAETHKALKSLFELDWAKARKP